MKYDIYFHNDLDGRASAAVLLRFLKEQGDAFENYIPVDYAIKPRWEKMKFPARGGSASGGKNPAMIVDFMYHPRAAFWFDHHTTPFLTPTWARQFRNTKFHNWNKQYRSCCRLVLDVLKQKFGFRPPAHLRELARWLDVVDGAEYKSPTQTIEIKEPALQLDAFVDSRARAKQSLAWLIKLLSEQSLNQIVKDSRIKKTVETIRKKNKQSLVFYKNNLKIVGRVGLIDVLKLKTPELRFAPYYYYPNMVYNIIVKQKSAAFHVTVGVNPWRRRESKCNIGKILQGYGGGGHKNVGGLEVPTREKTERIIKQLTRVLNS